MLKALKLNGKEIKGRYLQVDFDVGRVKASYKPNLEDDGNKLYNKDVKRDIDKKWH